MDIKPHAITLLDVTKSFGATRVFSKLNFAIGCGEIVLIIGPNGSGKSTLLKLCSGLLKPNSGEIKTNTRSLNFMGHDPFVYDQLTVRENLEFFSTLSDSDNNIELVLAEWNLAKFSNQVVLDLSKGTISRTGLARTFLNAADLILLDEPTSSLDESSVSILKEKVKAISKQDKTCVIASHDISRLHDLPTRVIVLNEGIVKHDSKTNNLNLDQIYNFYFELNR